MVARGLLLKSKKKMTRLKCYFHHELGPCEGAGSDTNRPTSLPYRDSLGATPLCTAGEVHFKKELVTVKTFACSCKTSYNYHF